MARSSHLRGWLLFVSAGTEALQAVLIAPAAIVLAILFWPRRGPYVRDVVSTRNGWPWERDREPY